MTVLTLTNKLNAIWYVNDTENDNKQPIVERRDVKSLFENYFKEGINLSAIPDYISDNSLGCEMDEFISASDTAFDKMLATCNKKGQLALEDVVQSQLDGQEFDVEEHYVELCHRLGTALDIDTSDNETNNDYWGLAWQDGLSPYQAVVDSIKP
jgi:hypothetical protein